MVLPNLRPPGLHGQDHAPFRRKRLPGDDKTQPLIDRDGAVVFRAWVGCQHRHPGLKKLLHALPDQSLAMTLPDHSGLADELVDAPGRRGQMRKVMLIPAMDSIVLQIGKRLIAKQDDPSRHPGIRQIILVKRIVMAPPTTDMRHV